MDRYRAEYDEVGKAWYVLGPEPDPLANNYGEEILLEAFLCRGDDCSEAERAAREEVERLNNKHKEPTMANNPSQCSPDECQDEIRLIVDFIRGGMVPTDFASAVKLAQAVSCVICCGLQQLVDAALPHPMGSAEVTVAGKKCHAIALDQTPCTPPEAADQLEQCLSQPKGAKNARGATGIMDWGKLLAFLVQILPLLFKGPQPS